MMSNAKKTDRRFHGLDLTLKHLCALRTYANSINLKALKRSTAEYSGDQHSTMHGRGMDFDEVRVYQPGDDIRAMDWRVTARTGRPHTKLFKEEREQPVYLITNLSASMQFGTQVTFKSIIAAQVAALLAWKSVANNDRIGGIVYNSETTQYFKTNSGQRGVLPLLKKILSFTDATNMTHDTAEDGNDLLKALIKYQALIKTGSKLFIISDFINFKNDQLKLILTKLAKNNELMFIHIYDVLEAEAPQPNRYAVSDGKQIFQFDSNPKKFREAYSQTFLEKENDLRKFCQQRLIKLISLRTDDDIINSLQGVH